MKVIALSLLSAFLLLSSSAVAQSDPGVEPPLAADRQASSPYSERYRWGTSLNLVLSNFGFAFGGTVERTVSPYTSIYTSAFSTGLRDVAEQTFTNFLGQQFIPNKFNRVLSFPVLVGVKQRLFPEVLSDNFRFNLHLGAGLARSFVYPYFWDFNGNGVWDGPIVDNAGFVVFEGELIWDPLQGWDKGRWQNGLVGELGLSVDFGDDFETFTSVYFGAMLFRFPEGIQVLEPIRYSQTSYPDGANSLRPPKPTDPFELSSPPQRIFISPVIRFNFGRNWRRK